MTSPLSQDKIAQLLALPARKPGGGPRKPAIDTSVRTLVMWWKLPTKAVECTVANHDEAEASRKRMCIELNGENVCRYCYLTSRDKHS